jgi:hypothetical protein
LNVFRHFESKKEHHEDALPHQLNYFFVGSDRDLTGTLLSAGYFARSDCHFLTSSGLFVAV